jgi:non-ribosomal peptide synthetase component F
MAAIISTTIFLAFFLLTFLAWRLYLRAAQPPPGRTDTCEYSLTEVFGDKYLVNVPHQKGARWLTEVFGRSARKYPDFTALQIPHTGESLTFAELDARAENVAAALAAYLTGPDQVVAVAMPQDNWQIVAAHLGVLKAGGVLMFLDTSSPEALQNHMLDDARPVVNARPETARRPGWTTPCSDWRPCSIPAGPPACPRASRARTRAM